MCQKRLLIVTTFLVMCEMGATQRSPSNSWIAFMQQARGLWSNCTQNNPSQEFFCAKQTSLDIFDQLVSEKVIPLTGFMRLIKLDSRNESHNSHNSRQVQTRSERRMNKTAANSSSYNFLRETSLTNLTWSQHILRQFRRTFATHVLQIDLKPVSGDATGRQLRGRHRRRHQMLPMMVFGMTALGMVLVPIGFQFLAVLGGKALLLAKMALLLASINGLKRVASSGVHYGLYHSVPDYHHPPGFYDRGDIQGPRQLLTGEGVA